MAAEERGTKGQGNKRRGRSRSVDDDYDEIAQKDTSFVVPAGGGHLDDKPIRKKRRRRRRAKSFDGSLLPTEGKGQRSSTTAATHGEKSTRRPRSKSFDDDKSAAAAIHDGQRRRSESMDDDQHDHDEQEERQQRQPVEKKDKTEGTAATSLDRDGGELPSNGQLSKGDPRMGGIKENQGEEQRETGDDDDDDDDDHDNDVGDGDGDDDDDDGRQKRIAGAFSITSHRKHHKNAVGEREPRTPDQKEDSQSRSNTEKTNKGEHRGKDDDEGAPGHRKEKPKKTNKNALTKLVPGYKAPLKLSSASSLDRYRPAGGLEELRRRALQKDHPTLAAYASAATAICGSFKKGVKRAPPNHAGHGWFDMTPTPMTDDLKKDLTVLRNRNYLDPKRFYKSPDKVGKFVQVGTVIEGPTEFYSARLTKKQRRTNLTDEIMADPASSDYARNKFRKIQQERLARNQQWNKNNKRRAGKRGRR